MQVVLVKYVPADASEEIGLVVKTELFPQDSKPYSLYAIRKLLKATLSKNNDPSRLVGTQIPS